MDWKFNIIKLSNKLEKLFEKSAQSPETQPNRQPSVTVQDGDYDIALYANGIENSNTAEEKYKKSWNGKVQDLMNRYAAAVQKYDDMYKKNFDPQPFNLAIYAVLDIKRPLATSIVTFEYQLEPASLANNIIFKPVFSIWKSEMVTEAAQMSQQLRRNLPGVKSLAAGPAHVKKLYLNKIEGL